MKIVKMPKTSMLNKSTLAFWKKEEGEIVWKRGSPYSILKPKRQQLRQGLPIKAY